MGNGIAHVFAKNNYSVSLVDVAQDSLDRAITTITKNLDRMVKKEKISEKDKTSTLNNITTYTSIEIGVKNADLVVEAARKMWI